MRPFWWWYALGFLLIAATQGLTVWVIDRTRLAIDALTVNDLEQVGSLLWRIAGAALIIIVVRIGSRLMIFTPGRLIELNVRNVYYEKLLLLKRNFFSNHETGDLVSRCSNDIAFIRAAYGFAILQLANVFITFVFGLRAMWRMDSAMTLYLAIPMLISFAIIQWSIYTMFLHWKVANQQIGQLSNLCMASYRGVATVQGYHAEPIFIKRFQALNQNYLNTNMAITGTRSFVLPLVQLVGNLSVFLILWVVGPKVINGTMTLGQVTAFLGYVAMVMPPLLSLGWMLNVFNRALPAMERLDEVLLADVDQETLPNASVFTESEWQLDVRNLFTSKGDATGEFQLADIALQLEPGKLIGIVGPIGSGKTVLLDTLLRLNELAPNQVYFNGQDAAQLPLSFFRSLFSYAPQNPFLFSTSLRENLKIADPQASDDQLLQALTWAGFELDAAQFPSGLDTEVGEKGVMLSGGQKQRMALARAFLKPSPILVLDDVLSAVDHQTERKIVQTLRSQFAKRGLIIVSHRVSAIRNAQEILVMDQGRIVDRGTHQELLQKPGFYQDIVAAQSGGGGER